MTKISEAFTTSQHGPSPPHGPRANLRKEGWGVLLDGLDWTCSAWQPSHGKGSRGLRTCVKGSYAALDGINTLQTHIDRARVTYTHIKHTQSVRHKPDLSSLINKTYRTGG